MKKAVEELKIDGVYYNFLHRNFNADKTEQTDVYEAVIGGVIKRAYLTCKIPETVEEVHTPMLDGKCLDRLIAGEVVEPTEKDYK